MSHLTTHVLDTSTGTPVAGIPVRLLDEHGVLLAAAATDRDGRVRELGPELLPPGAYRLEFEVRTPFLPRVVVHFTVADERHHHVPLLLSPYGFTTYRGS